MNLKEAKKHIGNLMTLSEIDNLFCIMSYNSLYGCNEGSESIERLIKEGKSNFSYEAHYWRKGYFCVEFALIWSTHKSSSFEDSAEIVVEITDVWEH